MVAEKREKEPGGKEGEEFGLGRTLFVFFYPSGGPGRCRGPWTVLDLFSLPLFGSDLPGGLLLEGRGGMNGAWRLGLGHLPVHVNENACSVLALH